MKAKMTLMKNPLKNLNTLLRLNPCGKTAKRMLHGDEFYGTTAIRKGDYYGITT